MEPTVATRMSAATSRHVATERWPAATLGHVAVFRALQLGDMLCAVPTLRTLRSAMPHARLTLIGLPWAAKFARRFAHYVDDFMAFPGAPGLPERASTAEEIVRFQQQARAACFDGVLQLHGSGAHSNPIALSLGARRCAGFYRPGEPCPDPELFLPYPEQEPEVRRLLRLPEFLDMPSQGESLEFPIVDEEWRAAVRLQATHGLRSGEYVCVHPGARLATRRWPPERFARVADALAGRGLRIVLTGTSSEEALVASVANAMRSEPVNLAGRTQLGELAAVLAGARLLVCNDTGVSHLAAALRVPSVVIYTASSPERWAPSDAQRHRRVSHPIDCRPCEHAICPIGHGCTEHVSAEDVIREIAKL